MNNKKQIANYIRKEVAKGRTEIPMEELAALNSNATLIDFINIAQLISDLLPRATIKDEDGTFLYNESMVLNE